MQIKITCRKEEFAVLLHRCFVSSEINENCPGCVLYDFCGTSDGIGDNVAKIAEFELTEEHT